MARPLLADPDFVAQGRRRPRRRDQHLHRLQPGLPRPRLREQAAPAAWSTRAPAARPSWCCCARRGAAQAASRWSAPGRPGWPPRRRCAERGHAVDAVRGGRRARRAVPARQADPGQGGVRRDDALLPPAARGPRRRRCGSGTRGDGRRPRRRSTRSSWPPASCRGSRRSPASSTPRSVLRRRARTGRAVPGRRVAVIGAGGIGVDVVGLADPHRGGRSRSGWRTGASATRRCTSAG